MASVWKRLQRVNKRAAKFQYTASYHRIDLETSAKWKPNKLSIVWTRRSRRVVTEPQEWEPSLKDPLKGAVQFPVAENHTVAVTLFKDSRTNELEDKDWSFVLEDVSPTGKRRRLAVASINMRKHASLEPSQRSLVLSLEPTTHKIRAASVHLTLHCVLLREGQATDEDMQSLASLLSVNNNSDIAVLEDLDEDDYTLSDHSTRQMLDLRQQVEEMTQSLEGSSAATPCSVQSLALDPAPAPVADLKITEEKDKEKSKSRPDFLAGLTKLAKDPPRLPVAPKPSNVVASNQDIGIKGITFKTNTVVKRNLKPLDLKINLNSISLDKNDNEEEDPDKTPTAGQKLTPGRLEKDKTPVQDLLEWCQMVTREYKSCKVTNLTTSFRSGLAFCAIIHRFRPDLIDFSGLQPDDAEKNVRAALEASSHLGIPQVLSAADVCPAPDRLAIMTYLFQLRAHFTGSELQVEQLGAEDSESSYLVGRHDTDGALPPDLFSREVATRRSRRPAPRRAPDKASPPRDSFLEQSKAALHKMVAGGKDGAAAEGTKSPPPKPERLMTRKELTDPFGSDEEDDFSSLQRPDGGTINGLHDAKQDQSPLSTQFDPLGALSSPIKSPEKESPTQAPQTQPSHPTQAPQPADKAKPVTPDLPKPTPQLLSRHDELKERARLLLEQTKKEAKEKARKQKEKEDSIKNEAINGMKNGDLSPNKKPVTEEERQAILRERARKLIADARAGVISPTAPLSPTRAARPGTVEIISKQSVMEEIAAAGGLERMEAVLSRADSAHSASSHGSRKSPSPARSEGGNSEDSSVKSESQGDQSPGKKTPLQSFSALIERLTPGEGNNETAAETGSYIASEMEALEREQRAVDSRAAALERQLRTAIAAADSAEEDRLMSQWFHLVNKKNALLRRQMQLNILEQEEDLSRRCELLARELRLSLAVEEWRKTSGQKRRERLLLQELLAAVNERDRLVQEMDEQEKAIAEDAEIEHNLSQVEIQRKNNCILQ